jgi:hypothetical protein
MVKSHLLSIPQHNFEYLFANRAHDVVSLVVDQPLLLTIDKPDTGLLADIAAELKTASNTSVGLLTWRHFSMLMNFRKVRFMLALSHFLTYYQQIPCRSCVYLYVKDLQRLPSFKRTSIISIPCFIKPQASRAIKALNL